MIKFIEIDSLKTEGLQTRDGLSLAVVKEYAELMKSGRKLPPLSVVRNAAGELFLTDGYHRLAALRRIGSTMTDVEITEGEYTDAIMAALKANAAHGLRRSNADKQNALRMAWEHREELFGGEPSHEMLADACAVSKSTAQRFRERFAGVVNDHPCVRVGKDGKRYSAPKVEASTAAVSAEVVDQFGTPVPERLRGAFKSERYAEIEKALRKLRLAAEAAQEEGDWGFCKLSQSTMITFGNLISNFKLERPYAVCPQCGGRGCRACNNIGVQTRAEYERNPHELRADRKED